MTLPTYEELYPEMLKVLNDGIKKPVKQIRNEIAQRLNLSSAQITFRTESGLLQYNNRVAWSLTYLKHAGAVMSPKRGYYQITEIGRELLNEKLIDNNTLMRFESFREFKNKSNTEDTIDKSHVIEETPEEAITSKAKQIDSELKDDILEKILDNSPFYFEKIVLHLLNAMGYGDSSLPTVKTGDGGIDGIINEDPLGLHSIYVQAKRWQITRTIGRPEIQKFKGAMDDQFEGLNQGVFITTAKFSAGAIEYVNNLKLAKIILIDGEKLVNEMIRYKVGVDVKRTIEIHGIDLDFFTEDD